MATALIVALEAWFIGDALSSADDHGLIVPPQAGVLGCCMCGTNA